MSTAPVNEDKILVLELQKSSVNAFDTLFFKYSDKLYGFAISLLKNHEDSKEIVQEAFCRIWDKRHELDSSKSFKSFLFTISYNLIIDHLRLRLKDKKYRDFLSGCFCSIEVHNDNKADYKIIAGKVKLAVEEFPKKRKEIYLLSREKGLSQKEIANKLGISVKTVENHINLSLNHIRLRLGKDIIS